MKGNLNQDDKQYFVLSFLPLFLLRTNLVSSLNLPSVLMNTATLKETILDTNPIVKKIVDVTRFPEDISMLVVTMLNHQEWKKMCLNFETVYTFNIELFICKKNCSQKPLTQTWIFNINVNVV